MPRMRQHHRETKEKNMELKNGQNIHGFVVKRVRRSDELKGTMYELEHTRTGAQLAWLDNNEKNKLFCISFKTTPEDSTGVFHIIEHTVLCGSDKYPVKEPFLELMKSSLNTFLNAMTFDDKTIYPISSRNEQDYLNLTSVYLDAVFAPSLLNNPSIFYQEGWHMESDESGLSYKGVVLNEMKGAMSGVDRVAMQGIQELVFPDNCYGLNSGGEPGKIQDLTYEKYVATYRKYYHPSNSKIYLDGAVPLDKTLSLIDSYLSKFDKQEMIFDIPYQAPKARKQTLTYEIGKDDDEKGKSQYVIGALGCTWQDKTKVMVLGALSDYLAESNESPLKKAVLESGLAQDLNLIAYDNIAQPWIIIQAKGTDADKVPQLRKVIRDALEKEVENGIDKAQMKAILSHRAYNMKELREPQGLERAINATSSWLYGGDLMQYLENDKDIEKVNRMLEDGEFEKILKEVFLQDSVCELTLVPSKTCGDETRAKEAARLKKEWDEAGAEGQKLIKQKQDTLFAWQKSEDTKEQLATIPLLSISDIDPNPMKYPTNEKVVDGVTVLEHPIASHGIIHSAMYFDLSDYSIEDLTRLSAITDLFTQLPTSKLSVQDIQRELNTHTGTYSISIDSYAKSGETEICRPMLAVRFSALKEHQKQAQELFIHILTDTQFDNDTLMKLIADQNADNAKNSLVSRGHLIARYCTLAHYSAQGAANEATSGKTMIDFLQSWSKDFEKQNPAIKALGERLKKETITKAALTYSITADQEILNGFDSKEIVDAFPAGKQVKSAASYKTKLPRRMGITIPAQISYAVKGSRIENYDGSLRVAMTILSLEYLWNVVRVQGGAYGAGIMTGMSGNTFCYSYRDPSPAKSLEVYSNAGKFLSDFCKGIEDCDKYIISTIADTEPLQSPAADGKMADQNYFCQVPESVYVAERKAILSADVKTVSAWADKITKAYEDACICVTGHSDALAKCGDLTTI